MAITSGSTVLGIFRDRALAEQATQELRHAGFRDDQIAFLSNGSSEGAFSSLRNLFSVHNAASTTQTSDTLNNLGLSEYDARYYQRELEAGNTVLAVQAGTNQQEAHDILYRHGAYDAASKPTDVGGTHRIPLRREELHLNKQMVQTGEIRVHKRVITENKTFTVPVTREELIIEHLPFTSGPSHLQADQQTTVVERRPAASTYTTTSPSSQVVPDEVLQDGGTLRIVLHEEQVTINKQNVITEEIIIRKEIRQEVQHITDTEKHEEVRVIQHGNVPIQHSDIQVENETGV